MRPPRGQRPAFLSASGAVAAALALSAVAAWTAFAGPGLFSPGPLNASARASTLGGVRSHAELRDCEACHTPPWSRETMAQRCLGCHTDVRAEVRAHRGLHGQMRTGARSCLGCHPEHRGATASLTAVDERTFPHDLTGYSLESHRFTADGSRVGCADCHPDGIAKFDRAVCSRCHARLDPAFMRRHAASFGTDCLPCHDGRGRAGSDFDHSRFPFKLTGKHAGVPCDACHRNAGSAQALRDTPRECVACHARDDEHKGRFGRQCDKCHNTSGWDDASFEHKIFPVDHGVQNGRGTCATCHPKDVSRYTCYGCHEHTPANVVGEHEGRSAAQLADCVKCHEGGREGGD